MPPDTNELRPQEPHHPGPRRGRKLERVAIGALLGAAAFLSVGQWIEATGGT